MKGNLCSENYSWNQWNLTFKEKIYFDSLKVRLWPWDGCMRPALRGSRVSLCGFLWYQKAPWTVLVFLVAPFPLWAHSLFLFFYQWRVSMLYTCMIKTYFSLIKEKRSFILIPAYFILWQDHEVRLLKKVWNLPRQNRGLDKISINLYFVMTSRWLRENTDDENILNI